LGRRCGATFRRCVLASLTDQRVERLFYPGDTEFGVECALVLAAFDQCDHRFSVWSIGRHYIAPPDGVAEEKKDAVSDGDHGVDEAVHRIDGRPLIGRRPDLGGR